MLKRIYDIGKNVCVYMETMGKIDERMYVIKCDNQLIVVDPNICEELLKKMGEWSITGTIILLTHEHYDHITGVKWLLENTEAMVVCSRECKRILDHPLVSVQDYYDVLIPMEERDYYFNHDLLEPESYIFDVDVTFGAEYSFVWQSIRVDCIAAPGHSIGGAIYIMDGKYVFTGDNLVNGSKVITRFPGGNRKDYRQITKEIIKNLSEDSVVFPGHGEMAVLKDLLKYMV